MNHVIIQQEAAPLLREECQRLSTARRGGFLGGVVFVLLIQPVWAHVADWWTKLSRSPGTIPAGRAAEDTLPPGQILPPGTRPPGPPRILPPASIPPRTDDAPADDTESILSPSQCQDGPAPGNPCRRCKE